ncbi:C-type lectin domain family 7 member A-like [Alligator sinensis]|uniref:C-type lectin domain family 7 member A-like n=1 Tax=Alligator sinensis TaxID=38654 RepID=A0A3Q0H8I3_ALLSI|nr:C-type lectin domain family 7 member A-like [Alligator sinensis]
MSEHAVTYSDVKFDRSKRKKPGKKEKPGTLLLQEETTTYSELKFQNLPEQQRSTRAEEKEGRGTGGSPSPRRRNKDPSATPLQWQLATLALGILCLILLIVAGVLGYNVCQPGTEQENPVMEGDHHTSKPTSYQKPSLPGTLRKQPQDTGEKCPVLWTAKQDRSYLFSPKRGTWNQCNSSCTSQSAELLKTETKEELSFITTRSYEYAEDRGSSTYYYPFWIGLSFDFREGTWVWADASALSSGLFVLSDPSPQNYPGGACAYLQGNKVKAGGCGDPRFCICEKKKEAQSKY